MTLEILLEYKHIIRSISVLKSVDRLLFSKLQLQVDLNDGSQLFIREIIIENILSEYSYHWQDTEGALICRWDKQEHHLNITSYPYHKHLNNENNILACDERNLKDVLAYVESLIP
mgnify:FL=1